MEQIHDLVWGNLMLTLSLGGRTGPSELEKLADNTEYSSQIKEVEATLKHQREILRGKQSAKNYIYRMLESEKEDLLVDEFHERIRLLNDEITQIKSTIVEAEKKALIIQEAETNRAAYVNLIKNNREWLRSVQEQLYALSPEDRKYFCEGMISADGIEVTKEEGGKNLAVDFKISFNQGVFEHLVAEGKSRHLIKMIYALLTFGMIVILMAGMILAARMGPHMEEQEPKSRANRRLAFIRQSSLLR